MSDKTILSLEGLCAGYGRGDAISDISLSLSTGEALCVVGQSGCGKSTLLKSVIGVFDKPVISGGNIVFDGCRLSELSQKRRCAQAETAAAMSRFRSEKSLVNQQEAIYRNPEKPRQIRR